MSRVRPAPDWSIADIGVTPDQTLRESNFFEELYPYKDKITATSFEDASFLERRYPGLRFVRTSGERLPFDDAAFDAVVCFAVLEHVGDRAAQRRFLTELLRVGKHLFLTTPNRGFPIELHTFLPFLHWLPQRHHQSILRALRLDFWAETNNLNLLTKSDIEAMLPPGSGVSFVGHRLLGLVSNLIVTR